jgi:flagellar motor switch protein FliN/FliY
MAAAVGGTKGTVGVASDDSRTLEFLHDVKLRATVEFGRSKMSIKQLLGLDKGAVVELNKISGEPLDIRLNGKLVARGEAVIVNDRFGIRVTEIISPEDFEAALAEIAK